MGVGEFVDAAPRLPHAADALARLFRDSEAWRELGHWYIDYRRSHWAAIEWTIAQLGTMFPASSKNSVMKAEFGEVVAGPTRSLSLLAVASERLARWDPDLARVAIREGAKTADHPLTRRTLALTGLMAGMDRLFVRKLLGEFEENTVTLAMLKDQNFKAPKVVKDFDA